MAYLHIIYIIHTIKNRRTTFVLIRTKYIFTMRNCSRYRDKFEYGTFLYQRYVFIELFFIEVRQEQFVICDSHMMKSVVPVHRSFKKTSKWMSENKLTYTCISRRVWSLTRSTNLQNVEFKIRSGKYASTSHMYVQQA